MLTKFPEEWPGTPQLTDPPLWFLGKLVWLLPFSLGSDSCRSGFGRKLGWKQTADVGPASPFLPSLLSMERKECGERNMRDNTCVNLEKAGLPVVLAKLPRLSRAPRSHLTEATVRMLGGNTKPAADARYAGGRKERNQSHQKPGLEGLRKDNLSLRSPTSYPPEPSQQ